MSFTASLTQDDVKGKIYSYKHEGKEEDISPESSVYTNGLLIGRSQSQISFAIMSSLGLQYYKAGKRLIWGSKPIT